MKLATIRKALVGALSAAIAAAVVAYPDGFTNGEIGTIVGAALVAGAAVFGIRNEPTPVR